MSILLEQTRMMLVNYLMKKPNKVHKQSGGKTGQQLASIVLTGDHTPVIAALIFTICEELLQEQAKLKSKS